MKIYMKRFDSDLDLSLAAYNAGASRVVRAGFAVPAIHETQQYVKKVKQALEHLREARKRS
jgi:soluble lytic murein transglycosylase-like protein